MVTEHTLNTAEKLQKKWQAQYGERYGEKEYRGTSRSGIPLKTIYTPADIANIEYDMIGMAGIYPYTRGPYPLGYQFQPWVMQQFHGFSTPEETLERTKLLIKEGMQGYFGRPYINYAFDIPTFYGFDPDDPEARGRVGLCGVPTYTVEDMDLALKNMPLHEINVGLAGRDSCIVLTAFLVALAEKRGIARDALRGNSLCISYDRAYNGGWGFPPESTFIILTEMVKYCSRCMPQWNPVGISGYNVVESGANAIQEIAITLSTAIQLADMCREAGLVPDSFLPHITFGMALGSDFFEEIAKLRAMRRMWARIARDRLGAKDPKSWQFRTRMQTCGSTLVAQQPYNNIVRVAIQALAGVLGGGQALHTNGFDEPLSLPTEEAVVLALRTQQIILHEIGVTKVTDPLGGSYYVEWLTSKLEDEATRLLAEMDGQGGYIKCWESGWIRQLVEKEVLNRQLQVDSREEVIVGLNKYASPANPAPVFQVDPQLEEINIRRIREFRVRRDKAKMEQDLEALKIEAENIRNGAWRTNSLLVEKVVQAARDSATMGEIMRILRQVFGWVNYANAI